MGDEQTQAPVTDDQELAKVLASMSEEAKKQEPEASSPSSETVPTPAADTPAQDMPEQPAPEPELQLPALPSAPDLQIDAPAAAVPAELEDIKKAALSELRPIVNKLNLPYEDKFDALLLVIRSSDDQSLIKAAYEAAEGITDEAKKAQALLDVVKEIEYFSSKSA